MTYVDRYFLLTLIAQFVRSGFPTGAHWRDQKGGSFRASCLSHTSTSLAAMVWCATFFDHQFRGIRFENRLKDGDGKSTEHPWGSGKTGIYNIYTI